MSLRLRITYAFLALILVTVGGSTIAHFQTVSKQLKNNLESQVYKSSLVVEQQIRRESHQLKRKLYHILSNPQFQQILFGRGQSQQTFTQLGLLKKTAEREEIDILKLINDQGEVVFSAHWPASFGAQDALHTLYKSNVSDQQLVVEAAPQKSKVSFEFWRNIKRYDQQYTLVIGFFVDQKILKNLDNLASSDALSLCPKKLIPKSDSLFARIRHKVPRNISSVELGDNFPWQRCYNSFDIQDRESTFKRNSIFNYSNPSIEAEAYIFSALSIKSSQEYVFVSAKSKKEISLMRQNILHREFWIALVSILIALVLALLLERKLTRPIEEIAATVHEIADGNFEEHQHQISSSSTPEFKQLMQDINIMANKIVQSKIELRKVERVAAWREIARGLAHEVKNPLTPILGAMAVIRRAFELKREDFPEILEEQSQAVIEEVERLKELSNAFANFARLPDPQIVQINMLELLQSVLNLYVDDRIEIQIINHFSENPELQILLEADKHQIRTLLSNLLKNALEAMENLDLREQKLRIELRLSKKDEIEGIELSIQDHGMGLSEDVIAKLFTPYFSTKGSRGTGLGLALCHRIVSEHRGSIYGEIVQGSELKGARFVVWLPLKHSI